MSEIPTNTQKALSAKHNLRLRAISQRLNASDPNAKVTWRILPDSIFEAVVQKQGEKIGTTLARLKHYITMHSYRDFNASIEVCEPGRKQSVSLLRFARYHAEQPVFDYLFSLGARYTEDELSWEFGYLSTLTSFTYFLEDALKKAKHYLVSITLYSISNVNEKPSGRPDISFADGDILFAQMPIMINERIQVVSRFVEERGSQKTIVSHTDFRHDREAYFFHRRYNNILRREETGIAYQCQPLDLAVICNCVSNVELFIRHGANIYKFFNNLHAQPLCFITSASLQVLIQAHQSHPSHKEHQEEVQLVLDALLILAQEKSKYLAQASSNDMNIQELKKYGARPLALDVLQSALDSQQQAQSNPEKKKNQKSSTKSQKHEKSDVNNIVANAVKGNAHSLGIIIDLLKRYYDIQKEKQNKKRVEIERKLYEVAQEKARKIEQQAKEKGLAMRTAFLDCFKEVEIGAMTIPVKDLDPAELATAFLGIQGSSEFEVQPPGSNLSLSAEVYQTTLGVLNTWPATESLVKIQKLFIENSREYVTAKMAHQLKMAQGMKQQQKLEEFQAISVRLLSLEEEFLERQQVIKSSLEKLPKILENALTLLENWQLELLNMDSSNLQQRILAKCQRNIQQFKRYTAEKLRALNEKSVQILEVFSRHYEADCQGIEQCYRDYNEVCKRLNGRSSGEDEKLSQELQALKTQQQDYLLAGNDIVKRLWQLLVDHIALETELTEILSQGELLESEILSKKRTLARTTKKSSTIDINEVSENPSAIHAKQNEESDEDLEEAQILQQRQAKKQQYLLEKQQRSQEMKDAEERRLQKQLKAESLRQDVLRLTESEPSCRVRQQMNNTRIVHVYIHEMAQLDKDALKVLSGVVINEFDADEVYLARDATFESLARLMEFAIQGSGKLWFEEKYVTAFRDGIWHSLELYRFVKASDYANIQNMVSALLQYIEPGSRKQEQSENFIIDSTLFNSIINYGLNSRDENLRFTFHDCLTELENLQRRLDRTGYIRSELKPLVTVAKFFLWGRLSSFCKHGYLVAEANPDLAIRQQQLDQLAPYQKYRQLGNDIRHGSSDNQLSSALLLSHLAKKIQSTCVENREVLTLPLRSDAGKCDLDRPTPAS